MLAPLIAAISLSNQLSPQLMSERLRLPLAEIAKLAGVHRNTLATRPESPAVQASLGRVARILAAAEDLTGDADRAILWFRHQPLAGHGGQTAQELVEAGDAVAVLAHLEDLRDGAYA